MKKVIVIGTIHLNWTPREELHAVLDEIDPDKVFIELCEDELNKPREDSIRDEMFHTLDWVIEHGKDYMIFDIDDNSLKEGVTGKEPDFMELELKSKELLKDHSWKDLNKKEPWQKREVKELENVIVEKYFDKEKMEVRNTRIVERVKENLIDGVNVVVTGAGHLDDFKKMIPEARLYFREEH